MKSSAKFSNFEVETFSSFLFCISKEIIVDLAKSKGQKCGYNEGLFNDCGDGGGVVVFLCVAKRTRTSPSEVKHHRCSDDGVVVIAKVSLGMFLDDFAGQRISRDNFNKFYC